MLFQKEDRLKILIISICSFVMIFLGVICAFSLNNLKSESKTLPDRLKKITNILVIFLNDEKKEADSFCIVSIDVKTNKIAAADVPRESKISYDKEKKSLREVYYDEGADVLKSETEKLLNVKIDKYICLDKDLIEKIVNITGDITVNFPRSVSFSKNGESFNFQNGENVLNPKSFALSLMYLSNLSAQNAEKLECLKAFFATLANAEFAPWQDKEFLNIVKKTKTDIASYEAEDFIAVFSAMNNADVYSITIDGKYEYIDGYLYFLPEINGDIFAKNQADGR